MTYTLSYRNAATGAANNATGVQMTDVLPAQVSYVPGSCTGCTYDSVSKSLSWEFASHRSRFRDGHEDLPGDRRPNRGEQHGVHERCAKSPAPRTTPTLRTTSAKVTTTVFTPSIAGTVYDDASGNGAGGPG